MADDIPDEMVIEVDPPISFNGGSYSEITLKEPTAKQVMQAESLLKPGAGVDSVRAYLILLVSLSAGVPKGVIEQLKVRQQNQAAKYVQSFIEADSPATSRS